MQPADVDLGRRSLHFGIYLLALLWQILRKAGFPNQFFWTASQSAVCIGEYPNRCAQHPGDQESTPWLSRRRGRSPTSPSSIHRPSTPAPTAHRDIVVGAACRCRCRWTRSTDREDDCVSGAIFQYADLAGTIFQNTDLSRADFRNAKNIDMAVFNNNCYGPPGRPLGISEVVLQTLRSPC